jgi:hypothetical protein
MSRTVSSTGCFILPLYVRVSFRKLWRLAILTAVVAVRP